MIQIMDDVFRRFGIHVCIKINNRKILSGIAETIGEADKISDITVAIDKMDKTGLAHVKEEMRNKGISETAIKKLQPILDIKGYNREKLFVLKEFLKHSTIGLKGVQETDYILRHIEKLPITAQIAVDFTLARGLNYYTGAIFEVTTPDVVMGSITGGGRYDNLTGIFGMEGVSGVGFSFGADRIYDVLNQLNLYPSDSLKTTQVMFVNFGEREVAYLLPILSKIRASGIRTEIYPDAAKIKKQMGYADTKHIPFVALVGENEMIENKITLKHMASGNQYAVSLEELIKRVSTIKS